MRTRPILVSLLILGLGLSAQQSRKRYELTPLWSERDNKNFALPSPDGKLVVRVTTRKTGKAYPFDEFVPEYFLQRNGKRLAPALLAYSLAGAMWSPDSDLLAMSSTDGGAAGNWKLFVFEVKGDRVVTHDVMRLVQADLAHKYPAGVNPPGQNWFSPRERREYASDPSWVNVNPLHWLSGPERLLVSASVPSSSSYGKNLGRFRGYVIDPRSGEILQSLSEEDCRKLWAAYFQGYLEK